MRVLFVLPRMGGGGAERVAALLANSLATSGDTVHIHTLVGGDSFYPLNNNIIQSNSGVFVNRSNWLLAITSQIRYFGKSFHSVRELIKQHEFDIVLSFLVATDVLVWLCKRTGLSFIHVCSERNDPTVRNHAKRYIIRKIYQSCDLLVCQGKAVANYYDTVASDKKIVIPNPIDPSILPIRSPVISKKIVAVGRLDKQKNFSLLIDSFSDVHSIFQDSVLEIYGEGKLRTKLQQQIDRLGLSDHVTLFGACQNLLEKISDAALFVLSSDFEGFPNVLLESMAIGLPVVSTDFATGVARELIDKENGIIVPVRDREGLSTAICAIIADSELQEKMGNTNRERAREYYIDHIAQLWKDSLRKVVLHQGVRE